MTIPLPPSKPDVPRLQLSGISKSFGGIAAVKSIDWVVKRGEIHALLGENGAGKSTLVKIVTGYHSQDQGTMRLDGAERRFANPLDARAQGVVAVYQDPKLFGHLDIAENIFMGIHPLNRSGTIDRRAMYRRSREILRELESDLDPSTPVAGLSIGDVQFVEFSRALVAGVSRVLILDEPTAALTPSETKRLFRIVRRFRDQGAAVVLISHRLEDLEGLVDTVTVLRDGERVVTVPAQSLTPSDVVRLMVGRSLDLTRPAVKDKIKPDTDAPPRLRVENLGRSGTFSGVSFAVHAGEVVAMAGLVGAGRSEVAQAIFGINPPDSGRVTIDGIEVSPRSPRQMQRLGIAYVPEDRDREGLITALSITKNIGLAIIGKLARRGILSKTRERASAERFVRELSIRAASTEQTVAALSGGNRQKVVLAKWLATDPKILILDEPTHGIDVATKAQVHQIIRGLADHGIAVLVISSDLPEVLRLGDRVLVMADGKLIESFPRQAATEEKIMAAATWRARRAA
jgi:rhamnose transport system ATP-binding protein